jgi:hypothetical protein
MSTTKSALKARTAMIVLAAALGVLPTAPVEAAAGDGLRDTFTGYAVDLDGTGHTEMKVRVHRARCGSQHGLAIIAGANHVSPTGLPTVGVTVGSGCRPKGGGLEPIYVVDVVGISGGGPVQKPVRPGHRITVSIDVGPASTTVLVRNLTEGWRHKVVGSTSPSDRYIASAHVTWVDVTADVTIRRNLVNGEPIAQADPQRVEPDDGCAALSELQEGTDFTVSITCGLTPRG